MVGKRFLFSFLCVYSFLFSLSIGDFGPSWDSVLGEFYFGDKQLEFWKTLEPAALDLDRTDLPVYHIPGQPNYGEFSAWARAHPEHIWSLGPTLSALSREVFFTRLRVLDSVTAQHLFLLPLTMLLLFELYRFASQFWNARAAAIAVSALALAPRVWADAHNNIKDVPLAVFFSCSIFYGYRLFRAPSLSTALAAGVSFGLALAAKANAIFLPLIFALWLLTARGSLPLRFLEAARMATIVLFTGVLLFFAASPYLLFNLPDSLIAQFRYLASISEAGGNSFRILPTVNALVTIAGPFLPFFLLGLLVLPRTGERPHRLSILVYLWAFLPILRASLPRANDFDVVRHWLEVQPAFALIIGAGFDWLLTLLKTSVAASRIAICVVCAPVIWWNAVNHPFNLPYYNFLIGGLSGAQERGLAQSTDYWGSSYREGVKWLNAHADPNADVYVGVGQHMLQPLAPVWLRPDLHFRLMPEIEQSKIAYVMYVTRTERYPPLLAEMDGKLKPVFSIDVDGGTILKILRRTKEPPRNYSAPMPE